MNATRPTEDKIRFEVLSATGYATVCRAPAGGLTWVQWDEEGREVAEPIRRLWLTQTAWDAGRRFAGGRDPGEYSYREGVLSRVRDWTPEQAIADADGPRTLWGPDNV